MTLKTVTGPSIRDALADARCLFGEDVVLLQSSPSVHGAAASVTVAFDLEPETPPSARPARRTAPPAVPEPTPAPAPRAYGYAATRKAPPVRTEPISAPTERSATADEVAELRARLAELEAALADVRTATPVVDHTPRRAPLVFVGPSGSGKTSLALRLAQAPHLVGAERPAVVIVAPEADHYIDPAPVFWGVGVPVAVVETAEEVRDALRTFDDADLLLVDTPSLPLRPERARPVVARLGDLLAPLSDVEVHFVVDATRSPKSLTSETVASLGLRPDALALTRLDEASPQSWRWGGHLGCPIHLISAGTGVDDLHSDSEPAPAPDPAEPEPAGYSDEELIAFFQSSPDPRTEPRVAETRRAEPRRRPDLTDTVFSSVEFVTTPSSARRTERSAVLA